MQQHQLHFTSDQYIYIFFVTQEKGTPCLGMHFREVYVLFPYGDPVLADNEAIMAS